MGRIDFLPSDGRFYKANLHSHGTDSDGNLTPTAAKQLYMQHGYSIYAYTDHNVLNDYSALNEPDRFLALVGFELDVTQKDPGHGYYQTCHINAIARDPQTAVLIPKPETYTPGAINHTIAALRAAGYLVHYNHPTWSYAETTDSIALHGFNAVEIFNYSCQMMANCGDGRQHYDHMLRHGQRLYCIACDDNHNKELLPGRERQMLDSCGGWTMFKAPSLTYASIIHALENGHFYCSSGPEVYAYYLEDGHLCVDCSPVQAVYLRTSRLAASGSLLRKSDCITHAAFNLSTFKGDETYVRLELVDRQGRMAFCNPFYFDTMRA